MVVVFPAPFGPNNPKISPSLMFKSKLSTAVNLPNFLVNQDDDKVDLVDIWNNQDITEEMREVFSELAMIVRDHIKDTTLNVTEYCKKIECWNKLKSRKPDFSSATKNHFSLIKAFYDFNKLIKLISKT